MLKRTLFLTIEMVFEMLCICVALAFGLLVAAYYSGVL